MTPVDREVSTEEKRRWEPPRLVPAPITAALSYHPTPRQHEIGHADPALTATQTKSTAADTSCSLPDSTCPEEGPLLQLPIDALDIQEVKVSVHRSSQPIADYTVGGTSEETFTGGAHFVKSEYDSTNSLRTRATSEDEVMSVKCESFHASSPEIASDADEPKDIIIDSIEAGNRETTPNYRDTLDNQSDHSFDSTRKRKYVCLKPGCSYVTASCGKMKEHNETHVNEHLTTGRFKCKLCTFANNHKLALQIHSVVHDSGPPYKCNKCDSSEDFDTARKLNTHVHVHTGEYKYSCSYQSCGYSSNHSSNMNRHYRLKHNSIVPAASGSEVTREINKIAPTKSKYKCNECSFVSSHKLGLSMHSVVHSAPPPYDCSHCKEERFETAKLFSVHVQSHLGEAKYFCDYIDCFYVSNHSSNIHRHYRLRHNVVMQSRLSAVTPAALLVSDGTDAAVVIETVKTEQLIPSPKHSLKCRECQFSTSNVRKWRFHRLRHFCRYSCSICTCKTFSREIIKKHYLSVHKRVAPVVVLYSSRPNVLYTKKMQCDICSYSCGSARQMSRHTKECHMIKKCSVCSYSTIDKELYDTHVQGHVTGALPEAQDSDEEDGEFICDRCHFRCKQLSEWKSHSCPPDDAEPSINAVTILEKMVYDSGTYPNVNSQNTYHCRKCGIAFTSDEEYSKHREQHGRFSCGQCDLSFDDEKLLNLHLKLHSVMFTPAIEKCKQCWYTTVSKGRLVQHMDAHHLGNGQYSCRVCQFSSGSVSDIYSHLRDKHKVYDLDVLKSYVLGEECSTKSRLDLMQETVDNLCTSQPRPSPPVPSTQPTNVRERATELQTSSVILNCDQCYYATRFKQSLTQHKLAVHGVPSAAENTSKHTSAKRGKSYGEKLVEILKSCTKSTETDWLGYESDYSMFTTPPESSPDSQRQWFSYLKPSVYKTELAVDLASHHRAQHLNMDVDRKGYRSVLPDDEARWNPANNIQTNMRVIQDKKDASAPGSFQNMLQTGLVSKQTNNGPRYLQQTQQPPESKEQQQRQQRLPQQHSGKELHNNNMEITAQSQLPRLSAVTNAKPTTAMTTPQHTSAQPVFADGSYIEIVSDSDDSDE